MTKLQPPSKGHGSKALRGPQLEGLPEDLQVERLTGNFIIDFMTFKGVNPHYKPRDAWYWFKDITRRHGWEIEDSDWDGDPEEIGQRGSQPKEDYPWDPKADGRDARYRNMRDDRRNQGFNNQAPASAGSKGCPEGCPWKQEYWQKDPWSRWNRGNDPWSNKKEKKEKPRPRYALWDGEHHEWARLAGEGQGGDQGKDAGAAGAGREEGWQEGHERAGQAGGRNGGKDEGNGGGTGQGGWMAEAWVERSYWLNWRRSPYETAFFIDLYDVATDENTSKVFLAVPHL